MHTASDEDDFASEIWDLVEFGMLHVIAQLLSAQLTLSVSLERSRLDKILQQMLLMGRAYYLIKTCKEAI